MPSLHPAMLWRAWQYYLVAVCCILWDSIQRSLGHIATHPGTMEVLWFLCLGEGKWDASSLAKRWVLWAAEEAKGRSIQKALGVIFIGFSDLCTPILSFYGRQDIVTEQLGHQWSSHEGKKEYVLRVYSSSNPSHPLAEEPETCFLWTHPTAPPTSFSSTFLSLLHSTLLSWFCPKLALCVRVRVNGGILFIDKVSFYG